MSVTRNLKLPRGWLVAWWRDEPFMLLTLGKTSYYASRFTGVMVQNPPRYAVKMLGVLRHNDAPRPIERASGTGGSP
jgi:hypothetical protein